jgi:uncharacterized protein
MTGRVVHFEIPLDDLNRGREFYKKTFGWNVMVDEGMDYTLVGTTEVDEQMRPKSPGAINGGMMKRQAPVDSTVITIEVDDITAMEKTIAKNGGKILQKKAPIGDGSIGFAGYFRDTEGNVVGLFERARP